MSKIEEVYDSIVTWKIGNEAGSKKVGIPLSEYMSLKGKILDIISDLKPVINQSLKKIITDRITTGACSTKSKLKLEKDLLDIPLETRTTETHTDLDTGKMKIEAISSKEPRSSEEIIELLKIDTANWKLSQYWNKEKTGYWLVSALVTKLKKEESDIFGFLDILKDYQFPIAVPVSKTPSKIKNLDHVCGILSLQDLHFGKAGNESMDGVVISLVDSMINQAYTSFHLDKVVVVIGGDCLNMDTFSGSTTNGTPVENSMSAQTSYIQAFEGLYLLLQLVKQHADEVKVVFIPGNHDRLSSFHLVHALSKSFQGIPDYTFYSEYSERKVLTYGENMFCFEHGDVSKKLTPLVYATEYPTEWGQTTYRTLFTGHLHTKKTTEFVTDNEVHGFTTKILPSLSSTDYWHYHNKFVGNKRAAIMELYHKDLGKVAEFNRNYKL